MDVPHAACIGYRRRPLALAIGAAAALALCLALAGPARASHTVTAFTLTVASPQAGASVNASSSTSLAYATPSEDVKKTIGHFAPGMIANPEAVPHCPQAQYLADACPADTRIGDAEAVIDTFPPTAPVVEKGRIYNQELLAGEAGRLGIIVDSASGKLFLTAPFYVRTNGDFGLDGILDDIPRLTPGLQVTKLSFTLYGQVNGRNYTRAPTSCSRKTSTGEAFGYEHDESASGPSSSYTPTGCDKLPFKPTFAISAGDRRSNRFNGHPPLHVAVTQQPGEAGVSGNTVTLPRELTPNTAALTALCNESQLAAGACPAASQVGTAMATSPFLATPLAGPVWVVQQSGVVLPALVADLRGRVPIKIRIATSFAGTQVKSTVTGVPDLPIGTFDLSLNGGPKGVLTNKSDLCFASSDSSRFRRLTADVGFSGHNGASISSKPRIAVGACAPSARASLRRARSARPHLRLRVQRHPDAKKVKRLQLRLPKGMRFVRAKVANKGAVKRRRTFTTSFDKDGVSKVTIRFRKGTIKTARKLQKRLRRGRKRTLTFTVRTVDTSGDRFRSKARVRVKRR